MAPSLSSSNSNSINHFTAARDPVHPTHVLSEIKLQDVPDDLVDELGIHVVSELDELDMWKLTSDAGISSADLAMVLQDAMGEPVYPEIDLMTPEARGMTIAFNDGRSAADAVVQPFLDTVHASAAHVSRRGKKIRVAIIDTGIDPDHPALDKKYKKGHDYIDGDKYPYEEANGIDDDQDGWIDEGFGHGTHIAGLVALSSPEAEIYAYRVLDADGNGLASDVAEAVLKATKDKVDIINLSLGMYTDFEPLRNAIAEAVDDDILVVASMGNDATNALPQYPAAYPNVIAVGSVNNSDELSSFSNFDPHMDAASPGEGILSCMPGGEYAVWSGTSQSTAIVSGMAALLSEIHKKNLARGKMRHLLLATGSEILGLPGGSLAKRVNFQQALGEDEGPCEDGKPQILTMQYTGEGCFQSAHFQDLDKVECHGDPAFAPVVRIRATEKENPDDDGGKLWFEDEVALGEFFSIDARTHDEDKLKSKTYVHIRDLDGNLLQSVRFETSCSEPLILGDRYGALVLEDYTPEP